MLSILYFPYYRSAILVNKKAVTQATANIFPGTKNVPWHS